MRYFPVDPIEHPSARPPPRTAASPGPNAPPIVGVVLAAGRSRRMGVPKALLELEGESFVARCVRALAAGGCDEVRVVVGPEARPGAEEIADAARALGAGVLRNPAEHSEQIDSLRLALRDPRPEAVVVVPVDHPRVDARVVRALVEAFRRRGAPVVLPTFGGARGHPALFGHAAFARLLAPGLPEGAKSVVDAYGDLAEEVPVSDAGVLLDVDTPDDLRRLRGEAG